MKTAYSIIINLIFATIGFLLAMLIFLRPLAPQDVPDAWTLVASTNGYAYRSWDGTIMDGYLTEADALESIRERQAWGEQYTAFLAADKVRGWWR